MDYMVSRPYQLSHFKAMLKYSGLASYLIFGVAQLCL